MRQETRALARDPIALAAILLVFSLLALFVGYPLYEVGRACVVDKEGSFTLAPILALSLRHHFVRPIANSLVLALLVATSGTLVGLLFAFAAVRTDLPFRGALRKIATLPIITPPFVIALSAILLFGRNGLVTRKLLFDQLGLNLYAHGFDVYGLGGLVLVETLAYFPTAYLLLSSVLGSIDPSIEEAARSLGAGRRRTLWRVTFPLVSPALFASFLLIFIESLADFGNPLTLGGRFNVLSVQAYLQITGNNDVAGGSALALALLVPSILVYLLQTWLLERRSYVTITGKASRPASVAVSPLGRRIVGAMTLAIVALIALFYGLVLFGSFVKIWGADSTLTIANYTKTFAMSRRDIVDSVILAGIAAPLSALLGIVIAWLLERRRFPGRRLLEGLALLSVAVPGTVIGIGYALAFSRPPVVLTGTAVIIVGLMVFRNVSVGLKATSSALKQIDRSLEEAAANLGAPPAKAFIRVTLPMLTPAVYSALVFGFVRAITAVSAVIFVVSGHWNLITVAILGFVDNSALSQAAALSVILVAIVLVVFEGLRRLLLRGSQRFAEL